MARLIALSALALAASSAVGRGPASGAPAVQSHGPPEAGAADLAQPGSPSGDAPLHAAPVPSAVGPAPRVGFDVAVALPQPPRVAGGAALLALAPKTSPPSAPRR
jgi:hypothetical protein